MSKSISRKAILKINDEAKNDFKFDVYYFQMHGEKVLTKVVKIDDKHEIEYRLKNSTQYKNFESIKTITLSMSRWLLLGNGLKSASHGDFSRKTLGPISGKRCSVKDLISASHELTDEVLSKIFEN